MHLAPGSQFERYTVEALLGEGGMGQVYRAFDPKLQRRVALKVLHAGPGDDTSTWGEAVARMLREARAAAALDHPNVVGIFDLGEQDGVPYIAMEFVAGVPLRGLVGAPDVSVSQRIRWLADIARALAAAHEAGIIHRDVKPENVLVRKDGVVKVLDFGIARRIHMAGFDPTADTLPGGPATITMKGALVGTPAYMAPEQVLSEDVDARADQFAWAVTSYELLSGALPWDKSDPVALMGAVLTRDPPPLSERCPELPPAIAAIVARCMSKNREDRYPSMRAVVDALDELAASSPSRSVPAVLATLASLPAPAMAATAPPVISRSTTLRAGQTPARSRWWLAAIGAVVIAASATAGTVGARKYLASRSPLDRPDAVLGCPVFAAAGIEEPSGWLGAATANLACTRARILLGGRYERTLSPAALLDLPTAPVDDFPRDPFSAPAARDKTIAAARQRATAWLDGTVRERHPKLEITIVLRRPDGSEIARGSGSRTELNQALRDAFDELVAARALPNADALDPSYAAWSTTRDVAASLAALDLGRAGTVLASVQSECARALPLRERMGADWLGAGVVCHDVPEATPPPVDRSSAAAFAKSAAWFPAFGPDQERKALAAEASKFREAEPDPFGQRVLARLEASLLYAAGDHARARQVALAGVQEIPSDPELWITLQQASYRMNGHAATSRAWAAWVPEEPEAWNALVYSDKFDSHAQRVAYLERVLVLSSDHPQYAINLAGMMLDGGMRERVRALAAHLVLQGPTRKVAHELIEGLVETSEGRFSAAMDRWTRVLLELDQLGDVDLGHHSMLRWSLELASILGRSEELSSKLYQRFLEPDPPRVHAWHPWSVEAVAFVCVRAPRDLRKTCMSRVKGLLDAGYFRRGVVPGASEFVRGASLLFEGDASGAATLLRSHDPGTRGPFVAELLDEAGSTEQAQVIDDTLSVYDPRLHGATMATVRSALRAEGRGDHAAARRLATRALTSWKGLDASVPHAARMMELAR